MRQQLLRMLAVAGTLVALSVPVFNVTHTASACSNPDCVTTSGISGTIDTFVSPISLSTALVTFDQMATGPQTTTIEELEGEVEFTVFDGRGNNQGWVANLSSTGLSSSLFPLTPIPASAISIVGNTDVELTCYGPNLPPPFGPNDSCSSGLPLSTGEGSTGGTLDMNPAVAVACPLEAMGQGSYDVTVNLNVALDGLVAEKLGSYPASWFGNFTVSVVEGQPVDSFAQYGCPAFGPPTPGMNNGGGNGG